MEIAQIGAQTFGRHAGEGAHVILVIDLGTTGVRCIAYSDEWDSLASNYLQLGHEIPGPGMFIQDLIEMLEKTVAVLEATWRDIGAPKNVFLAITNQRESLAAWDKKTGEPVAPSMNWQDVRYGSVLDELKANGLESEIHDMTGLRLFPYFTAGKMAWMLDQDPSLRKRCESGEIMMGTLDTWLIWSLTGGPNGGRFVTDVTNASRTCLMDLYSLSWSDRLLEWFRIPRAVLPDIVPSGSKDAFGVARHHRLPVGIPIVSVIGDQQASLLGQSCMTAGSAKNTYGTASAILINTDRDIKTSCRDLLSTVLYQTDGDKANFALEGSTGATGGIIDWLKGSLGFASLDEVNALAAMVQDSQGVYFVPAFSGLYAPYWDVKVRGSVYGLTMHTNKAHIVRAAYESIALQTLDVLNAAKQQAQMDIRVIKVDGGASQNEFLMQLQADILGIPVWQLDEKDITSRGAAYLAGMVLGRLNPQQIESLYKVKKIYEPGWSDERRVELYEGWKDAVAKARHCP
jgi:glycerol kinase